MLSNVVHNDRLMTPHRDWDRDGKGDELSEWMRSVRPLEAHCTFYRTGLNSGTVNDTEKRVVFPLRSLCGLALDTKKIERGTLLSWVFYW